MAFSMIGFSIMAFSIMAFSIMAFSIMAFSIMAFSIMAFSMRGLFDETLSIKGIQYTTHCKYNESRHAECPVLFTVIANVVILSVVMLNVIMLRVVGSKGITASLSAN
jgi:hypothetical protein